jgi:hypothetical protein
LLVVKKDTIEFLVGQDLKLKLFTLKTKEVVNEFRLLNNQNTDEFTERIISRIRKITRES